MKYKCPDCNSEYADPTIKPFQKKVKCMLCECEIDLTNPDNLITSMWG